MQQAFLDISWLANIGMQHSWRNPHIAATESYAKARRHFFITGNKQWHSISAITLSPAARNAARPIYFNSPHGAMFIASY